MAKIILSKRGKVLREMTLYKGRVTIGRSPHNDIVIDDLAVSGQHAVIVTTDNDSYLEDLNSTNGTQVNGQPVKKHFFQDQDTVALAQYRITYAIANVEANNLGEGEDFVTQLPLSESVMQFSAVLRVLDGPNFGKETPLTKAITSIGRTGVQTAVIGKHEQAYWITHLEGRDYPIVNDKPIGVDTQLLKHGDVIEVGGAKMKFLLQESPR